MIFPKSYVDLTQDLIAAPELNLHSQVKIHLEAGKIRMFAFLKMLKGFDIVSNVEQTRHNLCNIQRPFNRSQHETTIDYWIDLSVELLKFLIYSTSTFHFIVSTSIHIQGQNFAGFAKFWPLVISPCPNQAMITLLNSPIKYITGVWVLWRNVIYIF